MQLVYHWRSAAPVARLRRMSSTLCNPTGSRPVRWNIRWNIPRTFYGTFDETFDGTFDGTFYEIFDGTFERLYATDVDDGKGAAKV